ncbi:hypothetical protein WG922_19140 [Ramlibacter sp. AN1015]|uniref:hypothetical protein n=1 Tax=Ramlibacter sp. AN1015 TaxID=3133428 RepID=UPI0030BE40E1
MDTTREPSSTQQAPVYVENTDPKTHQQHGDMSHIPGWGADLERDKRPGVPMERTPPRLRDVHWDAPEHQHVRMQVLHSIERPGLTPIVGTTVPPSGLSGRLREIAFRYSESDMRHWMLLLMADRVNVGEGLLEDLGRGHIPNILAEMGARAEWRHNRAGFIRKALVASSVVALAVYLMRRNDR